MRALGADVELVGVDFNCALVDEATMLAQDEQLSSGVLHRFPAGKLADFFRAQNRTGTQGFIHYDIAATRLAPLGAWIFYRARMREPLGRHDGVASALRAYGDDVLLAAAAQTFRDALGRRSRALIAATVG